MPVVDVHSHQEQLYPGIDQQVGKRPGNAVHIVLYGRGDPRPEPAPQLPRRAQLPTEKLGAAEWRGVVLHRAYPDAPLADKRPKALRVRVPGVVEPVKERPCHLARPFRLGRPGKATGVSQQRQRLVDELPLHFPDDGLAVGVADVEVAVMEHEDFTISRH